MNIPPAPSFRLALLAWYDRYRRDLPWRGLQDPYATWVSEVMSQQTRVETVIPYFERWMARFPSLEALAASSEDEVFKYWEGLGYYSRARNLRRAAQQVVSSEGGGLPTSARDWLKLPGVGPYTAGAIASIAFGEPVPAIDGNVTRVLARVLDFDGDASATQGRARIAAAAAALVPPARPGDFNQALMELGALVCTPRSPRCAECPVSDLCAGRVRAEELPVKSPSARARQEVRWAFVVEDAAGRTLVARNPPGTLLGGMWQFPMPPKRGGRPRPSAKAALNALGECAGVGGEVELIAEPVVHLFSHIHLTVYPVLVRTLELSRSPRVAGYEEAEWKDPEAWRESAWSTLVAKIAASLGFDALRSRR